MGYICDVLNCQYKANEEFPLFKIPGTAKNFSASNNRLLKSQNQAWLSALKIRKSLKVIHVCGRHFVKGKPANFRDRNDCDWAPTLNLGYPKPLFVPNVDIRLRSSRKRKAETSNVSVNVDLPNDEELQLCGPSNDSYPSSESIEVVSNQPIAALENTGSSDVITERSALMKVVQTDMTAAYISALESELRQRCSEVYALKEKVEELTWTEKTFKNNPSQLKYFTGLPNLEVFLLLLSYISESLNHLKVGKCSKFQKFLLTLMKLRQNTSFVGLGFRFGITAKEASYIFKNVVVILHDTFSYVVHWPDRDSLRAKVPKCFREQYGNKVTVIIDCFEVRSEKPSSIRARAQIHSNYKGGPTAKYLIGITPHGFICFISDGYGGRVTDKFITDDCGILDNLIPGDVVLADRGFVVNELVAMKHATLNIPTFTRGLKQLHPSDIEKTRKIASVRIHVERIIGLLRNKFFILKHVVPIAFLKDRHNDKSLFDIIVKVCCILVNLSESVISLEKGRDSKKCNSEQ